MAKTLRSPVRYYGGKAGMVPELLSLFPPQDSYDTFIEGFGGGGSLTLACPRTNKMEFYNDLGENIHSLYKVIADKELFSQLKDRLDLTLYSERTREECKERLKEKDLPIVDRAFCYFYVNRSSFNGTGAFTLKTAVRRKMSKHVSDYLSTIDLLPEIHDRLSSVCICNKDIFELLEKFNAPNVFMYLDPPYVPSTRVALNCYEHEMSVDDHVRFAEMLAKSNAKILLSGYDNEIYRNALEPKFKRRETVSPLAKSGKVEVLWWNYELT